VFAGKAKKNSSELDERRTNVYENKGPLWKTCRGSGNVVDNKSTYPSKAGMLLKIKAVIVQVGASVHPGADNKSLVISTLRRAQGPV
jgi:hypothetical protein